MNRLGYMDPVTGMPVGKAGRIDGVGVLVLVGVVVVTALITWQIARRATGNVKSVLDVSQDTKGFEG